MNRRAFLVAAAAPAVLQDQEPDVPQLYQPELAGRPRARITDFENDPFIVGVEKRLRCTCGCNLDIYTCRTTDFTCTYSPVLHREVVALVEQEKTADEILAAFVAEHGETVLMAPPKEGFNWAGYLFPGVAIGLVGSLLAWVLVRRTRAVAPVAAGLVTDGGARAASFPDLSSEDAARLEDELRQLES